MKKKIVELMKEKPVTTKEISVMLGGPKNKINYSVTSGVINFLSSHYPLYEYAPQQYKILTDKDFEDYRIMQRNLPKEMKKRR